MILRPLLPHSPPHQLDEPERVQAVGNHDNPEEEGQHPLVGLQPRPYATHKPDRVPIATTDAHSRKQNEKETLVNLFARGIPALSPDKVEHDRGRFPRQVVENIPFGEG